MPLSKKKCQSLKKTCTDCCIEKPVSDFYKNRDQHHSKCKECMRKIANDRWANATEDQRENRRKYARKYFKEYRRKNREKLIEYVKNYREKNREYLREYWRQRYYLLKKRKSSGNQKN